VRVELDGTVLAESASTVMVFDTGLPTRYYADPTSVDFAHLVATDTVTVCPYEGVTSAYWSARVADSVHPRIGAVAHAGSARRELVLGDRVLEVVRESVRAPRPDVGEHRVVEALLELRAHRLAVGDRQQHR
jgi:hypothetical protein